MKYLTDEDRKNIKKAKATLRMRKFRSKPENLVKLRAWDKAYYYSSAGHIKAMLGEAKKRALKKELEFNIIRTDIVIPEYCPILGIPLLRGSKVVNANSPSLDRIDPSKGYVKGNIQVISNRANTIKNDATPEELMKVALFMNRS